MIDVLDIKVYDEQLKTKKLLKSPDKKLRESSIADNKNKLKEASIYFRDVDELTKNPYERSPKK